ncbi:MAG TPA: SWIM zinc finger family protein, partial [Methylomirabilota bacterium]|nr:SWIM zinc finger family protein [Methylomirabilota bacterium]
MRVRRFGESWWSELWIAALERLGGGYAARLRRGRSYARQGRVHDLAVRGGVVQARVTGSRPEPYRVIIRLAPLPPGAWARAVAALATQARFAARLLAGEMPPGVEDALRAAGADPFPIAAGELRTECSCPDWANPCKHVAAVHYVLGEFLDRDPLLLFE